MNNDRDKDLAKGKYGSLQVKRPSKDR